jgi:hypothetical protein
MGARSQIVLALAQVSELTSASVDKRDIAGLAALSAVSGISEPVINVIGA